MRGSRLRIEIYFTINAYLSDYISFDCCRVRLRCPSQPLGVPKPLQLYISSPGNLVYIHQFSMRAVRYDLTISFLYLVHDEITIVRRYSSYLVYVVYT